MLSFPDFSEKQLICIASYHIHQIRFANENFIVEVDGKIIEQASCHKIFAIFILGEATITTHLIRKLESFGISLVCLKDNFEAYTVFGGMSEGNTILRSRQYAQDERRFFSIARKIVENKVENQCALLKKIREKNTQIKRTISSIESLKREILSTLDEDSLMGFEGMAAKSFFNAYFHDIGWTGRSPRTKKNVSNLLLDIGYTFLFHFVEALLRIYGFDVYKGIYHTEFYQRKSLVCDVMEPFRPIIDAAMLKAHHLWQVREKDFYFSNWAYAMKPECREKYVSIFFRAILDEKESLYRYVQLFYWNFMGNRQEMPFYSYESGTCLSSPTT